MAVPTKKAAEPIADFDISQLLAGHEGHEKNISNLTERVAKLEACLETPQAVAKFFKDSTKDSRVLDGVFAEMFCRFMEEHEGVRAAVKKKMDDIDRNFFYKTFKRIWIWIYSAVLVVAGAIGHQIIDWLVSLFPHK